MDPHGQIVNRRRTTSASSRDHHNLGALAEDPAEEDQLHDEDTDTASTGGSGKFLFYFWNFQ